MLTDLKAAAAALRGADAVVSVDWMNPAGTLTAVGATPGTVIQTSLDQLAHNAAPWTAARCGIPLLAVLANSSFHTDEVHQERVAYARGRSPANTRVGQHIGGPDMDLAAMARAQGCAAFGPVHDLAELSDVLAQAVAALTREAGDSRG